MAMTRVNRAAEQLDSAVYNLMTSCTDVLGASVISCAWPIIPEQVHFDMQYLTLVTESPSNASESAADKYMRSRDCGILCGG